MGGRITQVTVFRGSTIFILIFFFLTGILKAMNKSVDPCEDFYSYACGGWLASNPIPDSKTSWSQFKILNKRNEALMRQMIQDPDLRAKYSSVSTLYGRGNV